MQSPLAKAAACPWTQRFLQHPEAQQPAQAVLISTMMQKCYKGLNSGCARPMPPGGFTCDRCRMPKPITQADRKAFMTAATLIAIYTSGLSQLLISSCKGGTSAQEGCNSASVDTARH